MRCVLILAIAILGYGVSPAAAAPLQCPATGHWYEVVRELKTWTDADAAAQSMSYLGETGHLVTINSSAEQTWFDGFMLAESPDNHIHAGGVQDPGAAEPGDGWEWATGEPMVYTHWYPGEPNQYRGANEDHMFIFAGSQAEGGEWADGLGGQARWFVVEYGLDLPAPTLQTTWGTIKALYP